MTSSSSKQTPQVEYREIRIEEAGQRLDNFLVKILKGVPKSRIYRVIRKGEVRVNKKREKPEYKLCAGDSLRIPPVRTANPALPPIPSESLARVLADAVLFEDDCLLVINKPSGIPVHGGTGVKIGLIGALRQIIPAATGLELVHRLDKGTSGCLLLAKDNQTLKILSQQFRDGRISKVYHALVSGAWPADLVEVNAGLFKHRARAGERFVEVSEDGKSAVTGFSIMEFFPSATQVEARPVTGRTHQIRVHAQLAGHPIVGDDKYAGREALRRYGAMGITRLCLHAAELALDHPVSGERMTFLAPWDARLMAARQILRSAPPAGD